MLSRRSLTGRGSLRLRLLLRLCAPLAGVAEVEVVVAIVLVCPLALLR